LLLGEALEHSFQMSVPPLSNSKTFAAYQEVKSKRRHCETSRHEVTDPAAQAQRMNRNALRYVKSSPGIIRLGVMMHIFHISK
jgi:hypothetical protein